MRETIGKTNVAIRQDVRYPQLTELSMIYEGATEEVAVRPPDLSPHGMFINTANEFDVKSAIALRVWGSASSLSALLPKVHARLKRKYPFT